MVSNRLMLRHPAETGVHVVNRTLADGTSRRYVYASRGGPRIGTMVDGDTVASMVRSHMDRVRQPVVYANVHRCRRRAAMRKMDFDLSEAWMQDQLHTQHDTCAISGLPFDYSDAAVDYTKHPHRPSVDRIDNAKGYTVGNVRIVLTCINIALNEWGMDNFIRIARAVAARHQMDTPS